MDLSQASLFWPHRLPSALPVPLGMKIFFLILLLALSLHLFSRLLISSPKILTLSQMDTGCFGNTWHESQNIHTWPLPTQWWESSFSPDIWYCDLPLLRCGKRLCGSTMFSPFVTFLLGCHHFSKWLMLQACGESTPQHWLLTFSLSHTFISITIFCSNTIQIPTQVLKGLITPFTYVVHSFYKDIVFLLISNFFFLTQGLTLYSRPTCNPLCTKSWPVIHHSSVLISTLCNRSYVAPQYTS